MRNVSGKLYRENKNTHFMFNIFLFENRDVYEKLWKIMGQPGTLQTAIQYGLCALHAG
jgi:hypothetical protein